MTVLQADERHQELIEELISDVAAYNDDVDRDLLRRAFAFAAAKHEGQQRRSGEDFINHPWGAAKICADLRLDEETPVVCVATGSHVYEKVISNIQEVRARGAHVIAIATDGNEDIQHHADDVIFVPRSPAFLQAVLAVLPLQLLAYRIARLRGLNVDQPRNLAKTVTVE